MTTEPTTETRLSDTSTSPPDKPHLTALADRLSILADVVSGRASPSALLAYKQEQGGKDLTEVVELLRGADDGSGEVFQRARAERFRSDLIALRRALEPLRRRMRIDYADNDMVLSAGEARKLLTEAGL
jgi:hypothetical protein